MTYPRTIVDIDLDLPANTIIKVAFDVGVPPLLPTWVIATYEARKFRILTEEEVKENNLNPVFDTNDDQVVQVKKDRIDLAFEIIRLNAEIAQLQAERQGWQDLFTKNSKALLDENEKLRAAQEDRVFIRDTHD